MSDSPVQFGCIRCKRSRTTEKIDALAEKTMFDVFNSVFDTVKKEAGAMGVAVPDEFRAKMIKWGIKNNLFPPEQMPADGQ